MGSVLCIWGFEASGPKPARRDHGVKLKLKTSEPAPDLRSAATPSAQACCGEPDAWGPSHGPWWRRPGPGARGQVGGLGPDLSVGRVWSVIWSIGPRAREPRVRGVAADESSSLGSMWDVSRGQAHRMEAQSCRLWDLFTEARRGESFCLAAKRKVTQVCEGCAGRTKLRKKYWSPHRSPPRGPGLGAKDPQAGPAAWSLGPAARAWGLRTRFLSPRGSTWDPGPWRLRLGAACIFDS